MAEEKEKPVYDEQPLQRLLEAAYVLQEHNHELKKVEVNLELPREPINAQEQSIIVTPTEPAQRPAAKGDYTLTLAQIVETQHQIQARHLELGDAVMLVAERVVEITKAGGASIGLVSGKKVVYRAAAGSMTLPLGAEVAIEKSLCVACLRTAQLVRCPDVNSEFLVDVEECRKRGIQSLIAVPVYHEDEAAGGLELYYNTAQAFTEQDVHTCQLMAGLVTEALARNKQVVAKKTLADERALVLEALEKLKPNLAALMEAPAAPVKAATAGPSSAATFTCRKCGHQLVGDEQFCGGCGAPRTSDYEPPSMQSKVASLWQMQEARKKNGAANGEAPAKEDPIAESEKPLADSIEEEMPELFVPPELRSVELDSQKAPSEQSLDEWQELESGFTEVVSPAEQAATEELTPPGETALAKKDHPWTSAASARAFLEAVSGAKKAGGWRHVWETRRGDIYLGIAVVLVLAVLRWGFWSSRPVSATNGHPATGHRRVDPAADLSAFDRLLISLGLADTPPTPESKGNPDTQVWVDLHTALYYCPGTDLYGKTPKGKFTSQRDAQLDQFEPAYRKNCD